MKKNYAAVALATVVLATSTPITVLADEGVATEATENTSEKEEKETSDSSEKEEKESSDSAESKDSESDEAESADSASDEDAESSDAESDGAESADSASDEGAESSDTESDGSESAEPASDENADSRDSEAGEDKSAESDAENASDKEDESSAETVSETVDVDSEKKEETEEAVTEIETEASEEKTEEVSETETETEVISEDLDIDLELVDEMMQDDYLAQYEEYNDPHGCLPVAGDSEFHLVMTDEYDTETSNWEVPGYPGHITDDQPAFLIWYYDQAEDDPYCYREKENRAVNFVVRDPNKSTDAAPVYGVRRYDGYACKEEYYIFTKGGRFDITDTFLKGIKYYMQQQESATGYVKDTQINVFCTDAQYVGGEDVAENPFGESAAVRHLDATTTVRFINKRELEGNEIGEEPEVIIPEEPTHEEPEVIIPEEPEVVVPVEPTEEPEIVVPAEPTPEVPEVVSEDPTPVAPATELTPVREVVAPKNEAPVVVNVSVKSERTRVKTDGDVLEAREVAAPMIAPPAPMMAPPAAIEAGHGIIDSRQPVAAMAAARNNVQTGDESRMMFWMFAMFASLLALVGWKRRFVK